MSKLVHSYMIKNVHFDIDIYTSPPNFVPSESFS